MEVLEAKGACVMSTYRRMPVSLWALSPVVGGASPAGDQGCPGRTCPMLGEGAAGTIEGSGTTFLCVQPRKEPSVGPAMGRTHLSGLPRSPLEAAPSSSPQQPLPVFLLSRSVGALDRESLAKSSGQRKGAKRLQNNPQVLGQESKTKHKSSTSSLSYSEASNCPSQISQPGLCHR